jgi:NDP-sugar pyrophosphorylase family protein
MLPVGGRPVLQHTLERLRAQGVGHVFLSVCHLAHVISDYFGDGGWLDVDIEYVVEQRPLGTAGAIGLLPELSKPLLVLNGDVLTPVPVAEVAAHHQAHGAAMTVGYVKQRMPVPYGVIQCTGGLEVLGLKEKPEIVLTVIAGVYVIAPEVVAWTAHGVPLAMPDMIESVIGPGRVVGYPLPGPWLDIGTPETYARAEQISALCDSPGVPAAHSTGLSAAKGR